MRLSGLIDTQIEHVLLLNDTVEHVLLLNEGSDCKPPPGGAPLWGRGPEGWAKGQHLLKVAAPKTRLESYVHVLMRVKDTKHAHFNKITAKLCTQIRILDAVSDVSDMAVCSLRAFMCTHRSL